MKRLKIRLWTCYKILFRPKSHWIFVGMDTNNLKELIVGGDVKADLSYHRMHEHNVTHLIASLAAMTDDIDMMLSKAKYEAESELYLKNKP